MEVLTLREERRGLARKEERAQGCERSARRHVRRKLIAMNVGRRSLAITNVSQAEGMEEYQSEGVLCAAKESSCSPLHVILF